MSRILSMVLETKLKYFLFQCDTGIVKERQDARYMLNVVLKML